MSAGRRPMHSGPAREKGISLFPAMMFLLVLAVLGIGTLGSTMMQEKMVGSTKDANLAFQMAEAGLRDAETDILNNITSATVFSAACANGLCTPPSTWSPPTSTDISKSINWSNPGLIRTYGAYTGAPALPLVAAQPVYVIEQLSKLAAGAGSSTGLGIAPPPSAGTVYRITVLATGARPETQVMLQSTYARRDP
jgi:type IV pilus assembly protein PilX